MGIFSSLLSFVIVVGAGYATIKYIVPYLQKEMGGTNIGGQVSGTEGSVDEAGAVLENLADAAGIPTEEGEVPPEKPKEESRKKRSRSGTAGTGEKKGKGEWLSSDKAGRDNRKKRSGSSSKTTAKTEYNIFEYDDYDYEEDDYY